MFFFYPIALLEGYIKGRIMIGDFKSVMNLLYAKREMQQRQFIAECLKRFKSKALCITRTMPFYIWQKIEIEKLRRSIFI